MSGTELTVSTNSGTILMRIISGDRVASAPMSITEAQNAVGMLQRAIAKAQKEAS